MRTIRPLRDGVLVRQNPPKEKLGSLFVPQGTRELYEDEGIVVAVGPGITIQGGEIVPVSVKPGDRVMFRRRPASLVNPDAREGDEWYNLLMLKDEDIVVVLGEEATPEPVMDPAEHKVDTTGSARECECH